MSFHFSGDVPSSKDKLNNLHNEDEISLAHACNNLLERPREALLTSRRGRKGGGGYEYRNTAHGSARIPQYRSKIQPNTETAVTNGKKVDGVNTTNPPFK